jgi:hypothetical protein
VREVLAEARVCRAAFWTKRPTPIEPEVGSLRTRRGPAVLPAYGPSGSERPALQDIIQGWRCVWTNRWTGSTGLGPRRTSRPTTSITDGPRTRCERRSSALSMSPLPGSANGWWDGTAVVGRCLQCLPARRLDDVGVPQAGHRHGDGQAADEPRPWPARRPANRGALFYLCRIVFGGSR